MNQVKPVTSSILLGMLLLGSGCGSSSGGTDVDVDGQITPPVITSITISGVCNEPSVVAGTAVAHGGAPVVLVDSNPHPSVWSLTFIPESGDTAVQVQAADGAGNHREYMGIFSRP